jgi:excisionase family DNA binding protein
LTTIVSNFVADAEILMPTAHQHQTEPRRRAEPPRLTVSVHEASHMTGLGLTTLFAMIGDGRLRSTKVGRRRLIFIDSIEKALTDTAA